jgi:hypothetical protein
MVFFFLRRGALLWGALLLLASTVSIASAQSLSPATSVVWQLQYAIPTISGVVELTPTTDPDQLLGAPGQYVAKTNFQDPSVSPDVAAGSVEVFADTRSLAARQAFLKVSSVGTPEHDVARGTVLLRIYTLSPASNYDAAFTALSLP